MVLYCLASIAAKRQLYCINNSSHSIVLNYSKQQPFWTPEIIIIIALFTILSGLRYDVGVDYLAYLDSYLGIPNENGYLSEYEFLFQQLVNVCRFLGLTPVFFFGICATIQISFFLSAFKNERYLLPYLVLFVFLAGEYTSWMNIIRQSIAMCITLYSLKYIDEGKPLKYLTFVAVAVLFHYSSVLYVLFYPLFKCKRDYFNKISNQIILYLVAIVLSRVFSYVLPKIGPIISLVDIIFNGAYSFYDVNSLIADSERVSSGTGMAAVAFDLVSLTIIIYSKRLKVFYNSSRFVMIYNLFFLGILLKAALPTGVISLSRPFRILYMCNPIVLSYFVFYLRHSIDFKYNKLISQLVVCLYIGIYYVNHILSTPDSHLWYQFYFNKI